MRVPKNSKERDKKAFLSDQYKEIEENNRMGKTRHLFKKIRDIKGLDLIEWLKNYGRIFITLYKRW